MSKSKKVWAAGGVLWREAGTSPEIGLIHRPRYDDWTLPKGKHEAGETLISTAVREIAEETGHRARLGRHVRDVSYELSSGTKKRVRYWSAESMGGDFTPNDEVDELRWVSLDHAAKMLSYRLDRRILRDFSRFPSDLQTTLLVRHAKAGRRSRYKGDDRQRPLDKQGREQARHLVALLRAYGVTDLYSADRVRCEETLAPSAKALDIDITIEAAVSEEAYADDPGRAQRRIPEIAASHAGDSPSSVAAICSQGKVIPPFMRWWSEADSVSLPAARNRKGSVWVLSTVGDRLVAADHIDSPLPLQDM